MRVPRSMGRAKKLQARRKAASKRTEWPAKAQKPLSAGSPDQSGHKNLLLFPYRNCLWLVVGRILINFLSIHSK